MKKHNRGAALAYTVMVMLIVFSVCTMVLTIMLSQVTDANVYSRNAERMRLSAQIGELFYGTKGDFEGQTPDMGASSEFYQALTKHEFRVSVNEDGTWEVTPETESEQTFVLRFKRSGDEKLLTVASGSEIYLRVKLGTDGKITAWQKGEG